MFKIHQQEISWGGRPLKIETGRFARQADGAVLVQYGETAVLCTVVGVKEAKEGADFFPLTVHYQDRYFAAGRFPGGYMKREGKPSEKEVLTSRLIDRPIRPLFPEGFYNEVQVVCTLVSHDMENDADVVSIIGASAALALSGIPFQQVVAAARVGYVDGKFELNPLMPQLSASQLDLVVAGTAEGILMVESEAQELSEATMLDAVMFAHESFQPVIKMIQKLVKSAGKAPWVLADTAKVEADLYKKVKKVAEKDLRKAYGVRIKQDRMSQIDAVRQQAIAELVDATVADSPSESAVRSQFKKLEEEVVRGDLLKTHQRIDGRNPEMIRPIQCDVGVFPRVHGSALFTRGETQAMVVATLGTTQDEQKIDAVAGEYSERFLLHYNFPPYSVGETGRLGSPGRREIGHGKLAWRALNPMIPSKQEFPYSLRIVSEITESNGSSSMATVCGSSLALMDAGVPLKKPVAGIAMGLVKEGKDFVVLSDILGDEDHLGDMDFKVAGTEDGITSLQMDLKITSIDQKIMAQALEQAQKGRLHILSEMSKALVASRELVSPYAPRMKTLQINKEKIRDLIGPGGKVIREICETTKARIEISEEGVVELSANSQEALEAAETRVMNIAGDLEIGIIVRGKVSQIMDFGAVVSFMGGRTGLVHISQLSPERVKTVRDVVKENDEVFVKIMEVDERGNKVKLSMKVVDQQTGQEIQAS